MKGKSLSAIGLIAALAGVAIILFYRSITSTGVVVTGGILFVAVGIANLIIYGTGSHGHHGGVARIFNQIANAAAIVLGICMLVFQSTFAPLVAFIFGLLVAVCSLWQFFLMAVGTRPYQLPGWLYIFPLLLAGAAIYIFVQKTASEQIIMLVTGISFAVLGLGCFIEGITLGTARRAAIKEGAPKTPETPETPTPATEETPKPEESKPEETKE